MNALGSSSKWPSYDSLPSTPSVFLSESEQTEDEADVFSEGEGDSGRIKLLSADERVTLSDNYLDFSGQSDELCFRSKRNPSECCSHETKHPTSASCPAASLALSSVTPGDLAFAQKVSILSLHKCSMVFVTVSLSAVKLNHVFFLSVCRIAKVYPPFA